MPGRDFHYIREKYLEEGARKEFENICYSVICKLYPQESVHKIRLNPGDHGIDVFNGDFRNEINCFQCKFFLDSLTDSRREAIRKSFRTFIKQHMEIPQKSWTLCLPSTLSYEDYAWWDSWKAKNEETYNLQIKLFDGDFLLEKLRDLGLYDSFFDYRDSFETTIQNIPASVPSNNLFHYSCPNMPGIYGRDGEQQLLQDFLLAEEPFQFWVISGPAGVGKTKLVYSFSKRTAFSEWRFIFVPKHLVNALAMLQECNIAQNTCLIFDYANEVSDDLSRLFQRLLCFDSRNGTKLRVLLIAREGMKETHYYEDENPNWFLKILKASECLTKKLFQPEFLELSGIGEEDYIKLIDAYCRAYANTSLNETDKQVILKYISDELYDPIRKVEPLYVLFSVDAFLQEKQLNHWNKRELLKNVLQRNYEKWEQHIESKELFLALLDMLRYATIVGEWDPNNGVPRHLQKSADTLYAFIEQDPSNMISEYFTTLTGKSLFRDRHYILSSLTPDIVGEFFVLDYLCRLTRLSKDGWITFFAENFAECKDFFLRSIQNYGDDQHFGHMLVSLFKEIIKCTKNAGKHVNNDSFFEMITSILRSYYSNFKGSRDPTILDELTKLIDDYSKEYQDSYQCWAELNVLRHRNTKDRLYHWRLKHFEIVASLYNRWPESIMIAQEYISFLGNLVEDSAGKAGLIDERTQRFLEEFDTFVDKYKKYESWEVTRNTLIACITVISAVNQIEGTRSLSTKYSRRVKEIIQDDYSHADLMACYFEHVDNLLLQLAKAKNDEEIKTTVKNTKQYIEHCLNLDPYFCYWICLPAITQSIVSFCAYHYIEEAVDLSHYFFALTEKESYLEHRDYMVFRHEESAINRIFKSNFTTDLIREIFIKEAKPFAFLS